MPPAIVELTETLFRWSPGEAPCLDIAAFTMRAGERMFLYGPSGSGKSTLLGVLGGVLVPERGSVRVLGKELRGSSAASRDRFRADHVGLIFQQFNLIPYLSAMDNVLLACRFSERRAARAAGEGGARAAAARLMSHLDLEPALHGRLATRLSVGQQQRVAAARALIGRPELVIADEPTSALDAERQAIFLDLLLRECAEAGSALLFVSHDRRLARAFDRELDIASITRVTAFREAA
jgi:putative ABC transport system ATP-binding protein